MNEKKDKDSVEQQKKEEVGQDIDPQRDADKTAHSKNDKTGK
jgi:hypothetical protein